VIREYHGRVQGMIFGHHRGDVQENVISNVMKGQSIFDLNGTIIAFDLNGTLITYIQQRYITLTSKEPHLTRLTSSYTHHLILNASPHLTRLTSS
jgi:hypothetical protein